MPTRIELRDVVRRLRHAPTRLAPIEVAERVQHTIVRLEQILASPPPTPPDLDAVVAEAERLIADCARLVAK